jgi:gamma-carbonic anhydrase
VILSFAGKQPRLGDGIFVAPTATVVGDVEIGSRSSIWFGAVLRGDDHFIRIGEETNIQDNVVIHEGRGEHAAVIGDRVTVGHSVTLHGCTIGDLCVVGMGTTILDGCDVGASCLIAAGSLLVQGTLIPPRTLAMGAPARVKRDLRPDEIEQLAGSAASYVALAARYLAEAWARSVS